MSHDNLAFTGSTDFTEMASLDPGRKRYGDRNQNGSISQTPFSLDVNGKSVSPAVADVKMGTTGGVYVIDIPGSRKASKVVEEYEPHDNRSVRRPITNTETLLHLLKGSLGTGILAMPNAFHHAGYAIGVAGTIFIGFICTYSIHLLVKSEYELCRRRRIPSLNYPDTASASMSEGPTLFQKCAPYAGHVVNIFLLIYQLGTCCVYVVFVSENIKEVVDEYYEPMDVRIYMVILLLPLILINWVRNLKFLAPFSTLANILTFIGFGITLYYIFTDIPSLADREPVGHIKHMPLFFGTVLFALEAIGVILPLENTMKSPKHFTKSCGVLNNAMILIITLYVGMGFFGYMKYGSGALGSITLNLSHTDKLAQSVRVMLAIAIFVTHALQCYVAVEITWYNYLASRFEKHPQKLLLEYVTRTVLVLITFLLAVAIPNLELFISLFGALCLAALGIGFPAIIETATFWYTKCGTSFCLMLARNTFLVVFSLLGLIVGTYTSISDIIHTFT